MIETVTFCKGPLDAAVAGPGPEFWKKSCPAADIIDVVDISATTVADSRQFSGFVIKGLAEMWLRITAYSVNHRDAEYAVILTQATLTYLAKLWSNERISPVTARRATRTSPVPKSK